MDLQTVITIPVSSTTSNCSFSSMWKITNIREKVYYNISLLTYLKYKINSKIDSFK